MLEQLNLRHLRAVAAIVRLGSVSAAAQAVSISQPAITQGLSKLERQLGISLFDRKPEGMEATKAKRLLPVGAEALPEGGVHFRVWAPRRKRVRLHLEADGASAQGLEMTRESDGYYSVLAERARAGGR